MRNTARFLSAFAAVLLAAAGLVVVSPATAHAAESRVVCNYDWVRVRSAATTSSREVGRLTRGTVVSGDQQGSWFRLGDGSGHVAAYYTCASPSTNVAAPAPRETPSATSGSRFEVCRSGWVRVRERATTASRELRRLSEGTVMDGTMQGTWFRLGDGSGYVAGYYACATSSAPADAPAPAVRVAEPLAGGSRFEVCRTPWVRVRESATTGSRELRRLTEGTVMNGTLQGTWLRLSDGSGHVSAYYACAEAAPASAPAPGDRTPLLQPTATLGSPTSPFGSRFHPVLRTWRHHNGVDLGNRAGMPVYAAESGMVTTVTRDWSAGLYIKIDHGTVAGTPRVGSGYLHLESAAVTPGQRVERGQLIGRVGSSGLSTKPHLHFITYESGQPVNPEKYIGPLGSLKA